MGERVSRCDDQRVYQPKIHVERIRVLYEIKEATGLPMTVLLDRAIEQYVAGLQRLSTEDVQAEDRTDMRICSCMVQLQST